MPTAKLIGILIIAGLIIFLVYFANLISTPASATDAAVYFTIEPGQSLNLVAANLSEQGLIKSALAFKIYARLTSRQARLLAGEHQLNRAMNIKQILTVLSTGGSIENERQITIIEGWQAEEIADYLAVNGVVDRAEFLGALAIANWRDKYDFLADAPVRTIEGFLFPDTYRVFLDAGAEEIIGKMLDNFDQKLTAQMRQDLAAQGMTIFEVVTLAAIIEREVPRDEDKKIIADIFLKRLAAGIALQSDATVNYVTGRGRAQPSLADLAVDSPYNTYKYRGLPPGPIANPGIASIAAVIYPTANSYYYFLTTLDDGRVIYSRTYQEHLNNKAKYLD